MARIKVSGGEPEFKLYPKGSYDLEVSSVEEGASRGTGGSQLVVKSTIKGGPHDGGKVTDFFSRNEKAGWRIKALLDACGVDYDEHDTDRQSDTGKPMKDWEFDTDDIIGCVYTCDADQEEYEGVNRQRWGTPRAPAGATPAAADNGAQQEQQQAPAQAAQGQQQQQQPRRVRRVPSA